MDPLLDCELPHFIDAALPGAGVSTSGSTSGISSGNCNSVVNVEFMDLTCGLWSGDLVEDIEKC